MTRINLHSHSIFSDGELSPEALAEKLAQAGVCFAALTDHDSIDGLPRFHEALKRRNIGYLSGVEITAQYRGREAHLLGYGFDAEHLELKATLHALRQERFTGVQSIAGPLRNMASHHFRHADGEPLASVAATGRIEIAEAIALIHRAGGRAFLAHPLVLEADPAELDGLLQDLKDKGLDGMEVFYEPSPAPEQTLLMEMAEQHGLLVCAGTDFHGAGAAQKSGLWVEMPVAAWKAFTHSICTGKPPSGSPLRPRAPAARTGSVGGATRRPRAFAFPRPSFVLRIIFPALLAIVLFVAAIWGVILPKFEGILIERKRDTILELTNSALSILGSYARDERAGLMPRDKAQEMAKSRIEALRYGPEGKDYFWIQDLHPRVIMHPYRPDLNGRDVAQFTDPRGVRIFVEFANLVRRKQSGYVAYVWQWKDDPERLEAKESYVSGFEPWGWVVGTGIYIDDVHREVKRIEKSLVQALLVIAAVLVTWLLYTVHQSLQIERGRQEMEESLRDSTQRYRALVEATTEGTLLVLDGRCRYANPIMLHMLGYSTDQLELLDLADLLARVPDNEKAWACIEQLGREPAGSDSFEAVLRRCDGQHVECLITLNPISFAGHPGFILLAKEVVPALKAGGAAGDPLQKIAQAAQAVPIGLFLAKASRRGVLVEMNAAARMLLKGVAPGHDAQVALADLFEDPAEYEEFLERLRKDGRIRDHKIHLVSAPDGPCDLSLCATLARDDQGAPAFINGAIQDISAAATRDRRRDVLLEKLQASLLFLHAPVEPLVRPVPTCQLETPVEKVAALMTEHDSGAALVASETGAAIGVVTDHDLRERVLTAQVDPGAPIRTIMSAPLATLSERAPIFEALMRMEDRKMQYLALEDDTRRIVGMIRARDLMRFDLYGPTVVMRGIARARTPDAVARCCARMPALVQALMDAGARPRQVTYLISAVCDAAAERFIGMAIDELGPPPVPFAFLAMGSHGRQEQTLLTDQDNAIIFASRPDAAASATASEYFLALGSSVCQWLAQAGYPLCQGRSMADNPRWCRPLAEWKQTFADWIRKAEPQELLEFSIFFDFRTVYGAAEQALELRNFIDSTLEKHPVFFPHLAQNAMLFKPPVRFLGKLYLGAGANEPAGQLNLKDALMPLVGFARLYALRHNIHSTHTLQRIEALPGKKALTASTRDAMAASYDLLMRLRLTHQCRAMQDGRPPRNVINPAKLGDMDEAMLKQAFTHIAAVQKKITYDFLGGGQWQGS